MLTVHDIVMIIGVSGDPWSSASLFNSSERIYYDI
jgi:hypothetical protein